MSSKERGQTKMEGVVENWNSHSYRRGRKVKFLVRGVGEQQEVP